MPVRRATRVGEQEGLAENCQSSRPLNEAVYCGLEVRMPVSVGVSVSEVIRKNENGVFLANASECKHVTKEGAEGFDII